MHLISMEDMMVRALVVVVVVVVVVGAMSALSSATDLKQQCGQQLVGLSPCLSYVGGNAKAPTMDCCTNLKQVLAASGSCICLLVQDHNDANIGVDIDVNLALGLPKACHLTPIYNCPALLHLSPDSPEAKVFTDFYQRQNATTATPTSSPVTVTPGSTSSDSKINDGGPSTRRLRAGTVIQEIALLVFFYRFF